MNDGDSAFARLSKATSFRSEVSMQERRREKGEENRQHGHEEFRATHFGYYIQPVSPGQPQ
jgi:hypothetical protein